MTNTAFQMPSFKFECVLQPLSHLQRLQRGSKSLMQPTATIQNAHYAYFPHKFSVDFIRRYRLQRVIIEKFKYLSRYEIKIEIFSLEIQDLYREDPQTRRRPKNLAQLSHECDRILTKTSPSNRVCTISGNKFMKLSLKNIP